MPTKNSFSQFVIIFNPNSTGDAPAMAKDVRKSLQKYAGKNEVTLMPTKHAGHAIELAYQAAKQYDRPLIISVSGDGGYNEVINGVLQAVEEKKAKKPTVTVVGAGNANDHYRVVHKQRSIIDMLQKEVRAIDLLKVEVKQPLEKSVVRYAHSYAGIGMTPRVAEELNRYKLNIFKEVKIMITALTQLRPVRITVNGTKKRVDSLIFANIREMAKVLTLTDNNSLHDGKFEVVEASHKTVFGLLHTVLRAATVGLKKQPKHSTYKFRLREEAPLQIDGEIITCKKDSTVTVTVAKDAIQTLL